MLAVVAESWDRQTPDCQSKSRFRPCSMAFTSPVSFQSCMDAALLDQDLFILGSLGPWNFLTPRMHCQSMIAVLTTGLGLSCSHIRGLLCDWKRIWAIPALMGICCLPRSEVTWRPRERLSKSSFLSCSWRISWPSGDSHGYAISLLRNSG